MKKKIEKVPAVYFLYKILKLPEPSDTWHTFPATLAGFPRTHVLLTLTAILYAL